MSAPILWNKTGDSTPCCEPSEFVKIKDLSLYYGRDCAFKDVNLSFNKGCISGIIGPSGCGKSSFIHSLNRMTDLIDHASVRGRIEIAGESVFDARLNITALRKKVGLIFQEPLPLPTSISKNISLPLKEHGFDNIECRVEKALRDVGLWDEVCHDLKKSASRLSGGQKQRLCIARTIALEPEIILMDEPCSSLDPVSTEKIENLILSLKGRFTILIVTHNLAQARRVCDYVTAFWYDSEDSCGKVIETGTNFQVFEQTNSPLLKEYLGGVLG